jgi:hypothetical protein
MDVSHLGTDDLTSEAQVFLEEVMLESDTGIQRTLSLELPPVIVGWLPG